LDNVMSRRSPQVAGAEGRTPAWPMIASILLAGPSTASASTGPPMADADPLATAKRLILAGDYGSALAALPADASALPLRVWCLESLGRMSEAAQVLAQADSASVAVLLRLLRADMALELCDVAEAMRQYEALAAQQDRYWFTAGYLCRYELADARGAGQRFERVRDPRLAEYVQETFQAELAAVARKEPTPLLAENFDDYELGAPADWTTVLARGSEFHVVEVPHGKALRQDEVNLHSAEFLTGQTDWADYTLQVDVKVIASKGNYAVGAAAYRRADQTGYVLELTPSRLRLVKQFAAKDNPGKGRAGLVERLDLEPTQAQMALDQPPATGWWYTLKIRVQRTADGVSVAGKFWRTDAPEPLGWQVVWTDTGQGGVRPLSGGVAGLQINSARVLIDNLIITRNEVPEGSSASTK